MEITTQKEWRKARLQALSTKFGSNASLGRKLGHRDGAYVGQMISGHRPITEKTIVGAEALPGCDKWFDAHDNIEPGPNVRNGRNYPLISDVQAGDWTEICDNFQPGDAEEWRPSHFDLGKCGYMLRVSGESMKNPHGQPTFPPGILLHVNPDQQPVIGQFVVVRRSGENKATFKKLVQLDGIMYLEAINPDWPERYIRLKEGDVFCGVVKHAGFDMP